MRGRLREGVGGGGVWESVTIQMCGLPRYDLFYMLILIKYIYMILIHQFWPYKASYVRN